MPHQINTTLEARWDYWDHWYYTCHIISFYFSNLIEILTTKYSHLYVLLIQDVQKVPHWFSTFWKITLYNLVNHHLNLNSNFWRNYRFFCNIMGRRARSLKEIKIRAMVYMYIILRACLAEYNAANRAQNGWYST